GRRAQPSHPGTRMTFNRGELLLLGLCAALALGALWACTPVLRGGGRPAYPYRWLEELDSPATRAWVEAEGQLTDAYLAQLPQRARIRDRIAALYDFEKTGVPFSQGGRYFYTSNSGHQDQSVLLMAPAADAAAVVALDPNGLPL